MSTRKRITFFAVCLVVAAALFGAGAGFQASALRAQAGPPQASRPDASPGPSGVGAAGSEGVTADGEYDLPPDLQPD
jgi:hypothetical protein